MSQSMLARLKRLQSTATALKPDRVIKFVPEPEGENSPEVAAKWKAYRETGVCDGDTVVFPEGFDVIRRPGHPTIIIEEVENWYGNSAHEIERERKAVQGPADDVCRQPAIVFDPDWFGNNAHQLAADAAGRPSQ